MYYFRGCASFAAQYASIIAPPIYLLANFRGCFSLKNTTIQQQTHVSQWLDNLFNIPSCSQTKTMYQLTQSVHPLRRPATLITANLSSSPAISSFLLLASSSSTWVLCFIQLSLTSINHQSFSISILSTSLSFNFSASTWLPRGCVDTSLHQLSASCNSIIFSSSRRPHGQTPARTHYSRVATRRPSLICPASLL